MDIHRDQDEATLSILNPCPKRMPGPVLLHHLVPHVSPCRLPAIDYQAADGARTTLSYPELQAHAEALSRRIVVSCRHRHDQDQLVVPVLLPQCPELYLSQLAILKAGGAFCPLNLDAPPERVRFILGDVSATTVITSTALRHKIDALELDVAVITVDPDTLWSPVGQGEEGWALPDVKPDSLAYVMYTSGSTGMPKGVGISHDAATQALLAHDPHIPSFSRFLQFAAPTFDVSVFEIFFPLLRGVTLVSCHRANMLNDLPAVLRTMSVDACELTPTVAGSLLRTRHNAPDLRLLLTIGEMLTEPVIKEFGGTDQRPSILWAMYGPTEATIHCTLQPSSEASASPHNVGFPLDTVSAFILAPLQDDGSGDFRVLPQGELGELAVGGYQTAVGYINRPEQTASVFVDTPYGRLYRTGDKALINKNGTLECYGRISDGQIKLRGQRIEPGEIEQAVLRTPGCHGAVASVIQGIIVVFCEHDDPQGNVADEVLRTCQDWLPVFMLPGDVVAMESFPRLPSGKVDRKKLQSDYKTAQNQANELPGGYQDDVERELAQLAEQIVGIRLDSSSVLSAVGIDSLVAIKLAAHLRQAGYNIGAIDVLESRTLSNLRSRAHKAEKAPATNDEEEASPVPKDVAHLVSKLGLNSEEIERVAPCAPVQVSMLAETLKNPDAYCNWVELQVQTTEGVDTIASWFQQAARCNEILRTGFVASRNGFEQVVWKQTSPLQIKAVHCFDTKYRLDDSNLVKPFSVQVLANTSQKHTNVLLQIYHGLYDGWSLDLLMSDLNLLARGRSIAKRPPFRSLSTYYHSEQYGRDAVIARDYWADYLLGFQLTPMPQMLAKNTKFGMTLSAQKTLDVDASVIRAAAARLHVSTQVLFQACLVWLWGSILGTEDIVIGNVTSGRTMRLPGIEDIMGPCLTTIPLRVRTAQVRTVKELLEFIHTSNRESLAHCSLPLSEIKKVAGFPAGEPLYDALFVYQESVPSREGQQSSGAVQQVAHKDYLETKLLVEIEPLAKGFQLHTTYYADVFHHGYMQLFLRQFECILSHVVTNLESDIASIRSCFSDNLISVPKSQPKTLSGLADLATLFENKAAEKPEKLAICFLTALDDRATAKETISYRDLNRLVNQIARHLKAQGASSDHTIAIIMQKSIMLYATILGILKCGCAYLPLLPSTPSERVKTVLSQAGPWLCIHDNTTSPRDWEIAGCKFISLENSTLSKYEDSDIGTPINPARIANVIYTSGSTGVPKGVCVTQLNICSNLDVLSRIYPVKEDSRMLQACSQTFDVSVFEILFTLTRGMCLCSATNDTLFSDLEAAIRALEVTHISMTPTVVSLIEPKNVPRVNFVVAAGELLTTEVARKWMGKLYNGYGPSEATNICTVKKITPEDHVRHLGFPLENMSAIVLSPRSLDIMPIGCVGELCFGGDQVVSGYLNLPEVTSEKFIQHPKYGRFYRTGDLGRMLADGSLLIVGRTDDQVKLRGQRIELGEVNAAVSSTGAVTNCVTILVNSGSSAQLACFYVPLASEGKQLQDLRASPKNAERNRALYDALQSKLPSYMIPSFSIPIPAVPMAPSGKVDKAKLTQLFNELSPSDLQAFGADAQREDTGGQWSDEEEKIVRIVAEVLNVPPSDIGRWTPLTSLGLDSVSAITASKALQRQFSRKVPISHILRNNSVARLGALVMSKDENGTLIREQRESLLPLELVEVVGQELHTKGLNFEKLLPCTPLQEAMLASSPGSSAYLNSMLLRLKSDPVQMKSYWAAMFQRHDILRTCFFTTNNREHAIVQAVLKHWEPEWLSFSTKSDSLNSVINEHAVSVPLAVDSGVPAISLAMIEDSGNIYLSFICHHAYYDGVAISRLLEEVESLACGTELPAAPSYEPFLREMLRLPASMEKFWKHHLSNFSPKLLPRSPETASGNGLLAQNLPISYLDLRYRLRTLNTTLLSLIQASWANLLRIILRSDDVCFGNVVNGRTLSIEGLDKLVAPCFNTIPLRVDFEGKRHNSSVVKAVQSLNFDTLQYQFTPSRRIQSLCSSQGTRLFDTLLLLQQAPRVLDESVWVLERDEGNMDIPLVCEVTPLPEIDSVEVKIHFDRSIVSDSFASFVWDTLAHIISMFLQYPSSEVVSEDSIPSGLRAKLDELALVHPAKSREERPETTVASEKWTEIEKIIRSVVSQISRVQEDKISRRTTIFQLGLDSINAVQVAAMIRSQGLYCVTAADVLENPTCPKLALKLANSSAAQLGARETPRYDLADFQERARNSLQSRISDLHESLEAIFPCSPLQMGMLKEFLESKGRAYLNFMTFHLDTTFNGRLKAAWCRLVESHEILRTGFTPLDLDDASFAMLQHVYKEQAVPVFEYTIEDEFLLYSWKAEVTANILRTIERPPWQVAIVPTPDGIHMHLAIHHAIYDAQSLQFMFQDLQNALSGRPLARRPSISSIVQDVIDKAILSQEEDKTFWGKQSPLAVVNHFPIMTPLKETERNLLVQTKMCSLPPATIEDRAKRVGVTIQAVAQASWVRVLSSYLGEASVVFGTVLSGRNSEITHNAVFPCIVTVPVIAQNSSSNRELLLAMMQYMIGLQRHQRAPLTDIQRWLGHPSTKLFDTLLVYQKLEGSDKEEERPWRIHDEQATVDYPVSIEIEQQKSQVGFRVTFASNVLPERQAELLLEQFDAVFCDLLEHPDGDDQSVLKARPDLFAIIPAEEPELKSNIRFLHEFVEVSKQRCPDKVALEFVSSFKDGFPVSRQWTYNELDANGNKVANMLADHVKTGDIIAVHFEKCPEAHFAMLGILKAGCALLALDPGAPASRREFILRDSGAAVLLTDQESCLNLDINVAVPVVSVDEKSLHQASVDPPRLSRPLEPADRSYCLYTSGTTGTPKGCEITHENAVQAMLAFQKLFDGHWDEHSRWLQFASYHFDVSVLEQYWTWSVGITLFAAPRDVILEDLVGTISTLQITHIDLTPSLARLIHPNDVPSLCRGVFITGGEQLKQEILDVWGPRRVIHNFYGPTETTIGVTTYPRVPINGKSSNIGKQFANVSSFVLQPGTEIPVLKGGVGELCVSGKLVGKGYLNREDLTAERFPTLKVYNERVYRTGDLVRVLHDGCIDFLGRADDQVKLRGQRLEIGEINHCIRSSVPEIKDVVTVVIRNEKQQKDLLVTFVVTDTQEHKKIGELRILTGHEAHTISDKAQRACRDKLPGYMVPTYVLLLPFIPLSPNNKAELKMLRTLFNTLSPQQLMAPSSTMSVTDLGQIGKTLCQALSRMSGVVEEDISSTSSIFELGVDSISVMRLARMLRQEGVQNAAPATILRNPILADLAQALGRAERSPVHRPRNGTLEAAQAVEACQHRYKSFICRTLGVKTEEIEYIAPCSALQQGMISRSRNSEESGAYFNTFRYKLAEGVSVSNLRSAWNTLMQRHSILRTRFVPTTEGYIQAALKDVMLPWHERGLQDGQGLDSFLVERRQAWISRNNQILKDPWELLVVDNDGQRWLVVQIFHGIYDATSFDLMVQEVAKLYRGEKHLIEGPSFLDALLHGPLGDFSFSKSFWLNHLKGIKPTSLSRDSNNSNKQGLSALRSIDFHPLEHVRKSLGVTQQAIVQALWSVVLQQHLPQTTFGIIVSGRATELEKVEHTIGPLFNTIPYRQRSAINQTWAAVVRHCHEFNTAVLPFQHVPLRDIQKWCSGGKSVFDTLFSFQRRNVATPQVAEGLWIEDDLSVDPDYPLALEATLDPDGMLQVLLVAQSGVVGQSVLVELLDDLKAKAIAMAENPESLCHSPDDAVVQSEQQQDSFTAETEKSSFNEESESHFEWTSPAQTIRQQIALLSEVDEASVNENTTLLELGLDSIDTVKLSARLKRAGISLSNSDLIKGQSTARLTALLAARNAAQGSGASIDSGYSSDVDDAPELVNQQLADSLGSGLGDFEQVLPPTPLQEAMVSEMVNSDFQLYFNHDVLEISPLTDVARLKEAWLTVFKNTPILRTVFFEVESQKLDYAYIQLIPKLCGTAISEVEVQSSDEIASIKNQSRERARQGRGRSDLFQVTIVTAPRGRFVVLSIAHALYDGWSLDLLHQDVEAAYYGTYCPRPAYAGYLRQILRLARKGSHGFWSDYISDARRTILPSLEKQDTGIHREEKLMDLTSEALRAFCKRHAISQQALAQACWAAVLASRSQRLDVTFGVVLSGRETEASEAMLFPTMNTAPVRAVFHGSGLNFLRYMQDNLTSISQFQHYPLRKIQALAQNGQGSLFNTLFVFQKRREVTRSGKQPLMQSVEGTSAVEYPVCIEAEVVGEKLLWRTACDGRYLSPARVAQLLVDIENVLNFFISSCEENVLKFVDEGVSICGLNPFQPQRSQATMDSEQPHTIQGDEEWSPTEQTIRNVLAEMAGIEPASVSKHHNLYHLGLDSIRAIKVSSALRKHGVRITVRDLTQATSIKDMALSASGTDRASASDEKTGSGADTISKALLTIPVDKILASSGLEDADAVEVLAATAMQTHMLSVWQNTSGTVFFPEFWYRLTDVDDDRTIMQAWNRLVEQTPILRTVFVATGSDKVPFLQIVLSPKSSVKNPFVSFAVKHDKVSKDFLVRLKIHHVLYDGISLPLILDQFEALLGNKEDSLPVLSKIGQQSQAWKSLVASTLDTSLSKRRQSFWTEYLQGCCHTQRSPSSSSSTSSADRLSHLQRAAVPDTAKLRSLCTQHGVSLQAVFLAAYAHVLATARDEKFAAEDILFGVYLANRLEDSAETLIYPTLCLVPLRVKVERDHKLFDLAAQVQRDLFEISTAENLSVGLWEIKEWTGLVVDSFVNFLSLPDNESRKDVEVHGRLKAISVDESNDEAEDRHLDSRILSWVQENAVKDAYPDALDVEASLQENGAMDIGVFGSRAKLGGIEEALVQKIVDILALC